MIVNKTKTFLDSGYNLTKGILKKKVIVRNYGNYFKSKLDVLKVEKKKGRFPAKTEFVTYGKHAIDLTKLSLLEQVDMHAPERVEALGRSCTTVANLTSLNLLPVEEMLEIVGARWQNLKGSKQNETVAAHLNLMVEMGGLPLTEFVQDPLQKAAIQVLYTHTHLVDERVNKMDSWLEKAFLRRELRRVLGTIVLQLKGCPDPSEIESALSSHFMMFARGAVKQLDMMSEDLETRLRKRRDDQSKDELEVMMEMLQRYQQAWKLQTPPESISMAMILNIRGIFEN